MAKFEQRVKINAPIETVWAILHNPSTWSNWFPDADLISGLSTLAPGSTFQFQHGSKTGTAVIDRVDEGQGLIRVTTTADGKQETHTFDIDRKGGFLGMGNDSELKYTLEYDAGGMLGEFVAGGNPGDSRQVKNTLGRLKDLAERQS